MKHTFTRKDSQAMKGIGILLMLWHHLFYSADSSHGLPVSFLILSQKQVIAAARFCKICVPVFVFVTAYGMAIKYRTCGQGRESWVRMTLRRYRLLMTPFLFVYVLAFAFCQIGGMRSYTQVYGKGIRSVCYMLADMLGLTYFTGTPTMNPTWWYMSVAVLLLFILPFLWMAVQKLDIFAVLILAGILFLAEGDVRNNQACLCILTASLGVWMEKRAVFGTWTEFCKRDETKSYIKQSMGAFICLMFLLLLFLLKLRKGNAAWILIYPGSAAAVAGLVCCFRMDGKIQKILCFFGKYSMYMFLTHTFLKSYYLHDIIYGIGQAEIMYLLLVLLSAALAVLLSFLYEKTKTACSRLFRKQKV